MIDGKPCSIGLILHFSDGEDKKQDTLFQVPDNKVFVVESLGVNAFLQPGQTLMASVVPVLDHGTTVFPIALNGESPCSDPEMPLRRFASQALKLYADGRVDVTAARNIATGKAQVEFSVSGRLMDLAGV